MMESHLDHKARSSARRDPRIFRCWPVPANHPGPQWHMVVAHPDGGRVKLADADAVAPYQGSDIDTHGWYCNQRPMTALEAATALQGAAWGGEEKEFRHCYAMLDRLRPV